jgi:hypothetical protein
VLATAAGHGWAGRPCRCLDPWREPHRATPSTPLISSRIA